jgi:hypothetical protein
MNDVQVRVLTTKQECVSIDKMKSELCNFIKEDFWSYFHAQGKLISFPSWHDDACCKVIEILEKRYNGVTYGKAQKIVNMTFKYLYCFEGALDFEDCFGECHMPLDSKILEWYRQNVDVTQHTACSYLDKAEYNVIKDNIKGYIDSKYNGGYTVLQSEFVIWDDAINNKTTTP